MSAEFTLAPLCGDGELVEGGRVGRGRRDARERADRDGGPHRWSRSGGGDCEYAGGERIVVQSCTIAKDRSF